MLVAAFAALGALAYGTVFGETHHATRTPLDPLAIAKNYFGLIADRRFVVPAATVSLIMGGLFSMFSAAPRILIEAMHFTPIQLGLFFAGTVLIVFAAGMLATKLAPRYGLDRSIRGGLFAAATGSIAMLLVSLYSPTFLPFLGAMSVFLLGMGIVNPLGTAQALSPFGEKAGAASALVGFWQMMTAAIGVWLAATISHEALFALGVVLTVFSLAGGRALHAAGQSRRMNMKVPHIAMLMRATFSACCELTRPGNASGARYRSYFPADDLVRGNIRIERIEILRAADAAQRIAAGGHQIVSPGGIEAGAERRRHQQFAVDRAAHRGDAADLVDGRPHHGEVEPVVAADIAVKHLADMQADMGRRHRPALGRAAGVERASCCAGSDARRAARRVLAAAMFSSVNIASTPSPISFSTSPPASWMASIEACA